MIAYHAASASTYRFPTLSAATDVVYFIHYAFVAMSGYVCGWYYSSPAYSGGLVRARRRLLTRAGKLLVLLVVSNVILYSAGIGYSLTRLRGTIDSWPDVFTNFVFSMNGKLVAFEILYFIALLLAAVAVLLGRLNPAQAAVAAVVVALLKPWAGAAPFLSMGLLGVALGLHVGTRQDANKYRIPAWGYAICPPILVLLHWNAGLLKTLYLAAGPLYVLPLFCEVLLWCGAFIWLGGLGLKIVNAQLRVYAQYTLVAYMLQMLLVRIGASLMESVPVHAWMQYSIIAAGSIVGLALLLKLLHIVRARWSRFDQLYKLFFA
jgi:hypothetical protein